MTKKWKGEECKTHTQAIEKSFFHANYVSIYSIFIYIYATDVNVISSFRIYVWEFYIQFIINK